MPRAPVARMTRLQSALRNSIDGRSDHSRIFLTLLSVGGLLGLAKLIGAAKEIAVAARYGISPTTDAYTLLMSFVISPVGIWTSLLTLALLPLHIRLSKSSPQEFQQFRREFFGFTILVGIAGGIIMFAGLSILLAGNWLGLHKGSLGLAQEMLVPVALFVPLSFVNVFLAVRLMAQRGVANSLLDGTPALVTCVCVLIFAVNTPNPLVWGLIAGTILQGILLMLAQSRGDPIDFPSFRFRAKHWNTLLKGLFIVVISQAILALTDTVDQTMAVHYGAGSNAALGYANRLMALPIALGVTAITRALLPALTDIRDSGRGEIYLRHVANRWMQALFAGGSIVTIVGWFAAPWAVRVFYQHGAFTPHDSVFVVNLLRASLFRLPPYFAGIAIMQLLVSRAENSVYVYVSVINVCNLAIKILGNYLLGKLFGVPGIMLATAVMYMFSMLALSVLSRRLPPTSL